MILRSQIGAETLAVKRCGDHLVIKKRGSILPSRAGGNLLLSATNGAMEIDDDDESEQQQVQVQCERREVFSGRRPRAKQAAISGEASEVLQIMSQLRSRDISSEQRQQLRQRLNQLQQQKVVKESKTTEEQVQELRKFIQFDTTEEELKELSDLRQDAQELSRQKRKRREITASENINEIKKLMMESMESSFSPAPELPSMKPTINRCIRRQTAVDTPSSYEVGLRGQRFLDSLGRSNSVAHFRPYTFDMSEKLLQDVFYQPEKQGFTRVTATSYQNMVADRGKFESRSDKLEDIVNFMDSELNTYAVNAAQRMLRADDDRRLERGSADSGLLVSTHFDCAPPAEAVPLPGNVSLDEAVQSIANWRATMNQSTFAIQQSNLDVSQYSMRRSDLMHPMQELAADSEPDNTESLWKAMLDLLLQQGQLAWTPNIEYRGGEWRYIKDSAEQQPAWVSERLSALLLVTQLLETVVINFDNISQEDDICQNVVFAVRNRDYPLNLQLQNDTFAMEVVRNIQYGLRSPDHPEVMTLPLPVSIGEHVHWLPSSAVHVEVLLKALQDSAEVDAECDVEDVRMAQDVYGHTILRPTDIGVQLAIDEPDLLEAFKKDTVSAAMFYQAEYLPLSTSSEVQLNFDAKDSLQQNVQSAVNYITAGGNPEELLKTFTFKAKRRNDYILYHALALQLRLYELGLLEPIQNMIDYNDFEDSLTRFEAVEEKTGFKDSIESTQRRILLAAASLASGGAAKSEKGKSIDIRETLRAGDEYAYIRYVINKWRRLNEVKTRRIKTKRGAVRIEELTKEEREQHPENIINTKAAAVVALVFWQNLLDAYAAKRIAVATLAQFKKQMAAFGKGVFLVTRLGWGKQRRTAFDIKSEALQVALTFLEKGSITPSVSQTLKYALTLIYIVQNFVGTAKKSGTVLKLMTTIARRVEELESDEDEIAADDTAEDIFYDLLLASLDGNRREFVRAVVYSSMSWLRLATFLLAGVDMWQPPRNVSMLLHSSRQRLIIEVVKLALDGDVNQIRAYNASIVAPFDSESGKEWDIEQYRTATAEQLLEQIRALRTLSTYTSCYLSHRLLLNTAWLAIQQKWPDSDSGEWLLQFKTVLQRALRSSSLSLERIDGAPEDSSQLQIVEQLQPSSFEVELLEERGFVIRRLNSSMLEAVLRATALTSYQKLDTLIDSMEVGQRSNLVKSARSAYNKMRELNDTNLLTSVTKLDRHSPGLTASLIKLIAQARNMLFYRVSVQRQQLSCMKRDAEGAKLKRQQLPEAVYIFVRPENDGSTSFYNLGNGSIRQLWNMLRCVYAVSKETTSYWFDCWYQYYRPTRVIRIDADRESYQVVDRQGTRMEVYSSEDVASIAASLKNIVPCSWTERAAGLGYATAFTGSLLDKSMSPAAALNPVSSERVADSAAYIASHTDPIAVAIGRTIGDMDSTASASLTMALLFIDDVVLDIPHIFSLRIVFSKLLPIINATLKRKGFQSIDRESSSEAVKDVTASVLSASITKLESQLSGCVENIKKAEQIQDLLLQMREVKLMLALKTALRNEGFDLSSTFQQLQLQESGILFYNPLLLPPPVSKLHCRALK